MTHCDQVQRHYHAQAAQGQALLCEAIATASALASESSGIDMDEAAARQDKGSTRLRDAYALQQRLKSVLEFGIKVVADSDEGTERVQQVSLDECRSSSAFAALQVRSSPAREIPVITLAVALVAPLCNIREGRVPEHAHPRNAQRAVWCPVLISVVSLFWICVKLNINLHRGCEAVSPRQRAC